MKTISPSVAAPYLPKTRFKPFWRWYKVDRMLHAGSNLDKVRQVFAAAIYHRPRIRHIRVSPASGKVLGYDDH